MVGLYLFGGADDGANRGCDISSFKNAFVASLADGFDAGGGGDEFLSSCDDPFNAELLFVVLAKRFEIGGAASNSDFSVPFVVLGACAFGGSAGVSGDSSRDDNDDGGVGVVGWSFLGGDDFGGDRGAGGVDFGGSAGGVTGFNGSTHFGGSTGLGCSMGFGGSTGLITGLGGSTGAGRSGCSGIFGTSCFVGVLGTI